MKHFWIYLLLVCSAAHVASAKDDEPLKQTYEGNIRGLRALMVDLQQNQPAIYQKLKSEFTSLDERQSRADTIAYTAYGISAGFAVYGIAKVFGAFKSSTGESTFTLTPFLLSLGASTAGSWIYFLTRPSPQEYLDFTNRHNRLNKKEQLQWNLGLGPKGASVGFAYNF